MMAFVFGNPMQGPESVGSEFFPSSSSVTGRRDDGGKTTMLQIHYAPTYK